MKHYKEKECERQEKLIAQSDVFGNVAGGGRFLGKERSFVLQDGTANIFAPIKQDVIDYFADNGISWWGGSKPTGHVLSSQIACLNHLFAVKNDGEAVLAMLNNIRPEFTEVLPIASDKKPAYIAFEVVSDADHLREGVSKRGSNCTSIDAFIYARHQSGQLWLIPIEWKYTEKYNNQDKSNEDRKGEPAGSNGKGLERMSRYNELITKSDQLKSLDNYAGSLYYFEPFYQLMRQTLWAENMIKNKMQERLKADNYLHIHVIPAKNDELLKKTYKASGADMESSWRSMLSDQSKYVIVAPQQLLSPIANKYAELTDYLKTRYWAS